MTNKEIAERLREAADNRDKPIRHIAREIANELDPQRLELGTVVWFRITSDDEWHLGTTTSYGIVPTDKQNSCWTLDTNGLEYKPAHILAPDEVAVLRESLRDLILSGVEQNDPRLDYIVMQIDRADYAAALTALAGQEAER